MLRKKSQQQQKGKMRLSAVTGIRMAGRLSQDLPIIWFSGYFVLRIFYTSHSHPRNSYVIDTIFMQLYS